MNKDFEIYRAPEEEIPEEDKARLDGYLAGKAEETELKKARAAYEAAIKAFKESDGPSS